MRGNFTPVLSHVAVACLPVLLTAILFGKLLWHPELAVLLRDIGSLTLANKRLIAESLLHFHELPGWNPFVLGGTPFLADASAAVLYPLNIVFLLFPAGQTAFAHTWYLAVHIPLAFAGFFLFFRGFSGKAFFSAIAALSLAGGGGMVSNFYMSGTLGGILGAGWLFYFWQEFLREKRAVHLFAASFFLALPAFSGDPQFAYMLGLFFVPILTFTTVRGSRAVLSLLKLYGLALLVASPQLLPSVDLLFQSSRELATDWAQKRDIWSMHPRRLLEFFLPLPFGYAFYENASLAPYLNGQDTMPFLFSIYPGFFLLPALLAAVIKKLSRAVYAWILLAIFFLFAAAGSYSMLPVNRWLSAVLPIWGSFRYPERLIVFAQLSLWLGLALALRDLENRRFLGRFSAAAFALLLVAAFCSWFNFPSPAASNALLGLALATAIAGIGYYVKSPKVLLLTLGSLVVLAAFDLGYHLRKIVYAVPTKITDRGWSPLVRLVASDWGTISLEQSPRLFTVSESELNWPLLEKAGAGQLDQMGKLALHQWLVLTANTASYFGISSPLGFSTLMNQSQIEFWNAVSAADSGRALSLKGTNYVAQLQPAGNFLLRKNISALPLFSVPRNVDFVQTGSGALAKLTDATWDWRNRITVQGTTAAPPVTPPSQLEFAMQKRTFNSLTLKVSARQSGGETWVLWNESFDRFWTAKTGDKGIQLYRGNFWANAFLVPALDAGDSTMIELRYHNPLVTVGGAFFLVWLLLGALAMNREKRKGALVAPKLI